MNRFLLACSGPNFEIGECAFGSRATTVESTSVAGKVIVSLANFPLARRRRLDNKEKEREFDFLLASVFVFASGLASSTRASCSM